MIFFLYGLDSYRRSKKLSELIAPYRGKYSAVDFMVFKGVSETTLAFCGIKSRSFEKHQRSG